MARPHTLNRLWYLYMSPNEAKRLAEIESEMIQIAERRSQLAYERNRLVNNAASACSADRRRHEKLKHRGAPNDRHAR
jgi:hypothetical protein